MDRVAFLACVNRTLDDESRTGAVGKGRDRPDTAAIGADRDGAVVGCRGEASGDRVRKSDVGRIVAAIVGDGDGEGNRIAHARSGRARSKRLDRLQVGDAANEYHYGCGVTVVRISDFTDLVRDRVAARRSSRRNGERAVRIDRYTGQAAISGNGRVNGGVGERCTIEGVIAKDRRSGATCRKHRSGREVIIVCNDGVDDVDGLFQIVARGGRVGFVAGCGSRDVLDRIAFLACVNRTFDGKGRAGAVGKGRDRPHAGHGIVRTCRDRTVVGCRGKTGRNLVGKGDVGRIVAAIVGDGDGEGDRVAHARVGRCGIQHLDRLEIGDAAHQNDRIRLDAVGRVGSLTNLVTDCVRSRGCACGHRNDAIRADRHAGQAAIAYDGRIVNVSIGDGYAIDLIVDEDSGRGASGRQNWCACEIICHSEKSGKDRIAISCGVIRWRKFNGSGWCGDSCGVFRILSAGANRNADRDQRQSGPTQQLCHRQTRTRCFCVDCATSIDKCNHLNSPGKSKTKWSFDRM